MLVLSGFWSFLMGWLEFPKTDPTRHRVAPGVAQNEGVRPDLMAIRLIMSRFCSLYFLRADRNHKRATPSKPAPYTLKLLPRDGPGRNCGARSAAKPQEPRPQERVDCGVRRRAGPGAGRRRRAWLHPPRGRLPSITKKHSRFTPPSKLSHF